MVKENEEDVAHMLMCAWNPFFPENYIWHHLNNIFIAITAFFFLVLKSSAFFSRLLALMFFSVTFFHNTTERISIKIS